MVEAPTRYSDADLAEFKDNFRIKFKSTIDLDLIKSAYMNDLNNGTDTSPTFKAFEEGSESMSKENFTMRSVRRSLSVI
jgi:hypothetical protein